MNSVKTLTTVAAFCWCAQVGASEAVHWTYKGATGPQHWGELSEEFGSCKWGKNQSPIDIRTENLLEVDLPPVSLDYRGATDSVINNGHTLQVNVSGDNTLTAEGETFQLSQFHFHSPSEHRIDGEAFPLEAHFVHKNEKGEIAVVGLLFQSGEASRDLSMFAESSPREVGKQSSFEHPLSEVLAIPLSNITTYYRYNGSLTTPPCSEGLRWFVIPVAATISAEQISWYIELIGADARGPQPMNARLVLHGK